jgi:hypothetical protein
MAKNPEDEIIKAMIQRTIEITKGFEESYRLKAFEIVLSKLWAPIGVEGKREEQKGTVKKTGATTLEAKIEEFAAKCDISVEQLKNIYDFQEDKPIYTIPLQENHAENQVLVSRYLLTAYHEVYGKTWVGLNQVLQEHGIGSLSNLAFNLKKHDDIFRQRGQRKAREYKLVDAAKQGTFQMIHDIANTAAEE